MCPPAAAAWTHSGSLTEPGPGLAVGAARLSLGRTRRRLGVRVILSHVAAAAASESAWLSLGLGSEDELEVTRDWGGLGGHGPLSP